MTKYDDQLLPLLEELAFDAFWNERDQHIAELNDCLQMTSFYHGPRLREEEFKRQEALWEEEQKAQEAEKCTFPFVRRYRGVCNLPVADAEQHASQEEDRAKDCDLRIEELYQKYAMAIQLLKELAPAEWGRLDEIDRNVFRKSADVVQAKQFREILAYVLAQRKTDDAAGGASAGSKTKPIRKIDVAIVTVVREPDLSDAEIAHRVGCDPSYLSKSEEYRRNAMAARASLATSKTRFQQSTNSRTGEHEFFDAQASAEIEQVDCRLDAVA